MTYEDYKSSKKKKNGFIVKLFNKLFTVIIFTMLVVIISNYSDSFRNFIINKVLNNTMDFSKINNVISKLSNSFKKEDTLVVSSQIEEKKEKYLDGFKYYIEEEDIIAKDSGIVTFIGKKDGYKNTIIIQQSNGYYAWYGNVKEKIKLYDYVEKDSIIGTASYEYYYVLLKDDKPLVIDEY